MLSEEGLTISLRKRKSLEDLIKENRDAILNDSKLLNKIEDRIENRRNINLGKRDD
ncbi:MULTISPECIES: FbpB family small basic protein [Sediminibacillus]|uniref:FbpB family small basic protein n=1 Tax=Sediminibacillus TaxID=482460 RepID=UPI0004B2BA1F|nr:FbpB family small basic protein [Sediminibacillus terrae]